MSQPAIQVVKLGGSLLALADLPGRLGRFLEALVDVHRLIIVGGGCAADIVRQFDHHHHLGEETAHWLAIRAMQFNACLAATILQRRRLVCDRDQCEAAWAVGDVAVADPLAWLEREHERGIYTPHHWQFTSDSIAAHIASQLQAERLTLLKSAGPCGPCDVDQAMSAGLVDQCFAVSVAAVPHVELVNLRVDPFQRFVLR